MSALLIVTGDPLLGLTLDQQARAAGWRVRNVLSTADGLIWVERAVWDLFIVDGSFGADQIGKLARGVWERNPLSRVVVCVQGGVSSAASGFLLDGYEVVDSSQIVAKLGEIIEEEIAISPKSGVGKVLVVEDLDSPRDIICDYVERLGYGPVVGVASGEAALQAIESGDVEWRCIVTDERMPKITGHKLIELVRSNPKTTNIPIVVLTAHGTASCLIDCLKAGATGFLIKPPKRAELQRELERADRVRHHRLSARLSSREEADRLREILIARGFID